MKKTLLLSVWLLLAYGVEQVKAQWIRPAEYQTLLGNGIDVDWWTAHEDLSAYDWELTAADYEGAGIQHVRIALSGDPLSEYEFGLLDQQINACLRHGLVPIIAYRPESSIGLRPTAHRAHIRRWWDVTARHYQDFPASLSFELLIEPNETLFATAEILNEFYENCVNDIRRSNPERILFIAPTFNSDPLYLRYLRIPSRHNGYLMAEWHFLSQGNLHRAWNNWQRRRSYEERWINRRIEAALEWQRATGIYTWVGGWTPGSYFGRSYGRAQEALTVFLAEALHRAHIPYTVRHIGHYYNPSNRSWHTASHAPMHTLFPRGTMTHAGGPTPPPPAHGKGFHIGDRPEPAGHRPTPAPTPQARRQAPERNHSQGAARNGIHFGNGQPTRPSRTSNAGPRENKPNSPATRPASQTTRPASPARTSPNSTTETRPAGNNVGRRNEQGPTSSRREGVRDAQGQGRGKVSRDQSSGGGKSSFKNGSSNTPSRPAAPTWQENVRSKGAVGTSSTPSSPASSQERKSIPRSRRLRTA